MHNLFCKRCGCRCHELNAYTDSVRLCSAFYLMANGFNPLYVDFHDNSEYDEFYFERTPELQKALADYRKTLNEAVEDMTFDELTQICSIPGSKVSPEDNEGMEYPYQPHGNTKERFAYMSWPLERRQTYIVADAGTRRRMVDEAYQRGE